MTQIYLLFFYIFYRILALTNYKMTATDEPINLIVSAVLFIVLWS